MKHKTVLFTTFVSVLMVGSVIALPVPAYASNGWLGGGYFSGLITYIEQKFGLDKTQVQNAVNEYKASITPSPRPTPNPQAMQTREKQRLDKLVSSGKITAGQETAILAEFVTLQAQDKTNPKNMQNDWKIWATANGIDPTLVMPFGGMGGRTDRGFGKRPTPTPTP
jgi:hypothetical protein